MTRLANAAAVAGLLLVAHPALAQRSPADATDHYKRGMRLFNVQRFDEAIAEFEKAYEITGDPEQLYNIAQAHRRAGNSIKAIEFYRTYLRNRPDAPNRVEVEERIATLERGQAPPDQTIAPPGSANAASPSAAPFPAGQQPAPYGQGQPAYPPYSSYPQSTYPPPPVTSTAYPLEPPRGHHTHDGFFFRVGLGVSSLSVARTYDDAASRTEGGGAFDLAFGYSLTKSLVLMINVASTATATDPSLSQGLYMVSGAYYFGESNFYVSGGAGVASLEVKWEDGTTADIDDAGVGFAAQLGKEWWLSSNWAWGVALRAGHASLSAKDSGDDAKWTANTLAALLTATYN